MIIVDRALEEREAEGRPIRVGLVGAGALGAGVARQFLTAAPGQRLVAISNRTPDRAATAYTAAGADEPVFAESVAALDRAIDRGAPVITDDPSLLAASDRVDAVIEATGTTEFGSAVAVAAIEGGKHVFINAELEATVGPVLAARAAGGGLVVSSLDGDQPGTQMNLVRFVRGAGFEPLVAGNIKGLQDHYRTPETQVEFAARYGLDPRMATSFADGTKISFEQAVVALSTGFGVACRGMLGYAHDGHIDDMVDRYDVEELRSLGGIVDYALGPRPAPGVFVFAAQSDERQRQYMDFFKMGPGPLYSFYVPYHLAHMEAPSSVARAVLFGDAVTAPRHATVEVITVAKRDLRAGEQLDGVGGYLTYGQCEAGGVARDDDLLPMGISEGCTLVRDVPKDAAITRGDVALPEGRLVDRLRREQDHLFVTND
ncbi:MAG TPA: Gfo/Idh/MocA family oxidoreductase [Acidimicrobiia bacterium]|nr:Gfo/Idh/MocA family oxidoreductase [Acidimicrobiia bacterium]